MYIISFIRSYIYIYKIAKNKLFNAMNTTMICLVLTDLIFIYLSFFMDSNLLKDPQNPNIPMIIGLINILIFILNHNK